MCRYKYAGTLQRNSSLINHDQEGREGGRKWEQRNRRKGIMRDGHEGGGERGGGGKEE